MKGEKVKCTSGNNSKNQNKTKMNSNKEIKDFTSADNIEDREEQEENGQQHKVGSLSGLYLLIDFYI